MRVLVTGGAGYIGSHTTLALLQAGHDVLVVDDLSNSSPESLRRVADLSGRTPEFVLANVRDEAALDGAFTSFAPDAVIHFAGWKAVGESTRIPLTYYRENLESTITLLEVMAKHGVQTIVFSSSATVYGDLSEPPFFEDAPTVRHQSLRPDQTHDRADPRRRVRGRLRPGGGGAALLQSDRRPRVGAHRRGPARQSPTTCCRSSLRSRPVGATTSPSSGTTTTPSTALGSATTSTSSTSRRATWPPWNI
jgi:hypothetical protein